MVFNSRKITAHQFCSRASSRSQGKGSHSHQGRVTSALGVNDRGVTHAGESFTPLTRLAISLMAVPTVLEKFVFYGYLTAESVSLALPTPFVHCCLVTARAFMPANLIIIP